MKFCQDGGNKCLVIKNLLSEAQQCSMNMTNLLQSFQEYREGTTSNELVHSEIMDLTPVSEFVLRCVDEDDYIKVLEEMFEPIDTVMPTTAEEQIVIDTWDLAS